MFNSGDKQHLTTANSFESGIVSLPRMKGRKMTASLYTGIRRRGDGNSGLECGVCCMEKAQRRYHGIKGQRNDGTDTVDGLNFPHAAVR